MGWFPLHTPHVREGRKLAKPKANTGLCGIFALVKGYNVTRQFIAGREPITNPLTFAEVEMLEELPEIQAAKQAQLETLHTQLAFDDQMWEEVQSEFTCNSYFSINRLTFWLNQINKQRGTDYILGTIIRKQESKMTTLDVYVDGEASNHHIVWLVHNGADFNDRAAHWEALGPEHFLETLPRDVGLLRRWGVSVAKGKTRSAKPFQKRLNELAYEVAEATMTSEGADHQYRLAQGGFITAPDLAAQRKLRPRMRQARVQRNDCDMAEAMARKAYRLEHLRHCKDYRLPTLEELRGVAPFVPKPCALTEEPVQVGPNPLGSPAKLPTRQTTSIHSPVDPLTEPLPPRDSPSSPGALGTLHSIIGKGKATMLQEGKKTTRVVYQAVYHQEDAQIVTEVSRWRRVDHADLKTDAGLSLVKQYNLRHKNRKTKDPDLTEEWAKQEKRKSENLDAQAVGSKRKARGDDQASIGSAETSKSAEKRRRMALARNSSEG